MPIPSDSWKTVMIVLWFPSQLGGPPPFPLRRLEYSRSSTSNAPALPLNRDKMYLELVE
jgi:hypothetical protein